jgi:hypothetical protein
MSDKKKPDGWVAWHPEEGVKPMNDEGDVGVVEDEERCGYAYLWSPNSPTGARLRKDGWRIRPVKLVFLDEEPSV